MPEPAGPPARTVTDDRLRALVDCLTLEEKVQLLTGRDSWSLHPLPGIGLRSIAFSDGPAGVRGTRWDERDPSTCFPSPTCVAASWDAETVEALGRALGDETAEKGVDVLLAPTINLQRTPFGGRHFEAYSEDPTLTGTVAAAYVRGVQAAGVAATIKHYVANDSETDRFTVDVRVDDRTLRELYLAPFETAIREGGPWALMSAYNSINGTTASESDLLETPLRSQWNFDGVCVSDWTAVRSLASARVPQDVVMPGPSPVWDKALVESVLSGDLNVELIDRKVVNVLRLAVRVGALIPGSAAPERVRPTAEKAADARIGRRQVARRASVDGTVLLANDGVLPLTSPTSIALIGEGFLRPRIQGGGSATVVPTDVPTPLEELCRRWPDAQIKHVLGAVVATGLTPIAVDRLTTPQGQPGIQVTCLKETGELLHQEDRRTSTLVWFDGSAPASGADIVELAFTYRPDTSALAPLGVAGLADVEVWADHVLIESFKLRTPPRADPSAVVLNPPWAAVEVPLDGTTVDVVVRFRPIPGEMPDALSLRIGLPPPSLDPESLLVEAERAATSAEVVVVMVGTSEDVESEGFDRTSLELPGLQNDLVRRVARTNPRTIVVVNAGSPVLLPWRHNVAAVMTSWFPGQEFGQALSDVLSGDQEPGGRLPVTWPSSGDADLLLDVVPVGGQLHYSEGLEVGHRRWLAAGREPAFSFGHGLGYTTWELEDVSLEAVSAAADLAATMRVLVTNAGARRGKTVLQVYAERISDSDVTRPRRWLVAHACTRADPGETTAVKLEISTRGLAHWTSTGWAVEPGIWALHLGLSAMDLRETLELSTH